MADVSKKLSVSKTKQNKTKQNDTVSRGKKKKKSPSPLARGKNDFQQFTLLSEGERREEWGGHGESSVQSMSTADLTSPQRSVRYLMKSLPLPGPSHSLHLMVGGGGAERAVFEEF